MSLKKKVLIGAGIFFGILVALVAIGSTYSPTVDEQANISRESYPLGHKYHPALTNQAVVVGDITYKTTDWHESRKLGDALAGATADGVFIVIDLEIENKGTQTIQISNNYFKLVDSQGHEFATDNKNWIYLDNNVVLKQLQPSLPTKGQLIFDVPKSIADTTYYLEISDMSGHDKKYILL